MTDYRPVACGLHDRYEAAIVKRLEVTVEWNEDEGEPRSFRGRLVDLHTRDGAEYLELGDGTQVRLDHIVRYDAAL